MKRFDYIDGLRGLSMLMVIYNHIYCWCLDIEVKDYIWKIFAETQIPLFFFVSGLFANSKDIDTPYVILKKACHRCLNLLLPTALVFFLYTCYRFGYDKINDGLFFHYKNGYWFPFILVLMNFLFVFVEVFFARKNRLRIILLCVISILLFLLARYASRTNNIVLNELLGVGLLAAYFPFYWLGSLVMKYKTGFDSVISSSLFPLLLFVSIVLLLLFPFYPSNLILGLVGVLLAYQVFLKLKFDDTVIGRFVIFVGKNTLPVYLLHFFFLAGFNLKWIGNTISVPHQWGYGILICAVLTLIITLFCLFSVKLISIVSSPLASFLSGKAFFNHKISQ